MEFTTQVALPVSVDRAMELRTDESLLRKAAERVNADLISISVVPVEGGAFTIEQVRRVSSELLPGAMRGLFLLRLTLLSWKRGRKSTPMMTLGLGHLRFGLAVFRW